MKRKWLAVGIILLFIGTCIMPTIAQDTKKPLSVSRKAWIDFEDVGSRNPPTIQLSKCIQTTGSGEILDQHQDIHFGGPLATLDQTLAQSFKPSMTPLIKIDLIIARLSTETNPLMVSIREDLDGNDLTSIIIPADQIPSWPEAWYSFDFPDIPVIPEKTYYIVIYCPHIPGYGIGDYGDVYPRGSEWISYQEPPQRWNIIEGYDLAFKTYSERLPPNPPTIHGPTGGKPGNLYLYTFTSVDPEEDFVYYYVDWGDGQESEWVGPYHSGATASLTHKWDEKGTYSIQAKAKDTYGNESNWSALQVHMPLSYEPAHLRFLDWLFERFPYIVPIFRYLLRQ
jgi:hypothetical protein